MITTIERIRVLTIEHITREADMSEASTHDVMPPRAWVYGVAALSGAVVAGALYLIATRAELLSVDLGPHIASWLWCL